MGGGILSDHFAGREPSALRLAQIEFMKRRDRVRAVNVAIGNVSLPMHPAMKRRLLRMAEGPHGEGVVRYTPTAGTQEANRAFLNAIRASGFPVRGLYSQITDGGSQAMELAILGTCGRVRSRHRPLMLIDPNYANYISMARRLGIRIVSVQRGLREDGTFTLPEFEEIDRLMRRHRPGAIVVIPYDNPCGQFYGQEALDRLAGLAVKHGCWVISDEAYRPLVYTDARPSSIWGVRERSVPGITGRRISIESASKVWNACGLRIGALVTDNRLLHEKAVAEYTANLSPNAPGQYVFGAVAHLPPRRLREWYARQRRYYRKMLREFTEEIRRRLPGILVSRPDASLYSVVDVRRIVRRGFDATQFVLYCARRGKVRMDGADWTLLVAPMAGFYIKRKGLGRTMMRIAYVETPENMSKVPYLFAALLRRYEAARHRRGTTG